MTVLPYLLISDRIAPRISRGSHSQPRKGILPTLHGTLSKIRRGLACFSLEKTVKMLFGAEPKTEGDLGELQTRKGQIALSAFYAGLLDEIVVGKSAVSAEDDLELILVDAKNAANVLNAPWVHEVAVDENDDIAVGREGQRIGYRYAPASAVHPQQSWH